MGRNQADLLTLHHQVETTYTHHWNHIFITLCAIWYILIISPDLDCPSLSLSCYLTVLILAHCCRSVITGDDVYLVWNVADGILLTTMKSLTSRWWSCCLYLHFSFDTSCIIEFIKILDSLKSASPRTNWGPD
mgnify:CR=1 FL=1